MALTQAEKEQAYKDHETRLSRKGGKSFVNESLLDDLGVSIFVIGKEADYFLAVVPVDSVSEYFGLDVYAHYSVGPNRDAFLCPARHDRGRCPVCEARIKLESRAGRGDDVPDDALKALWPTHRVLYWVLDMRDNESMCRGIQLYIAPVTIGKGIQALCKDRRTGEIQDTLNPETGKNITFSVSGKGLSRRYENIGAEARKPIPKELRGVISFQEILLWPSYEEIKAAFDTGGPPTSERSNLERRINRRFIEGGDETPRRRPTENPEQPPTESPKTEPAAEQGGGISLKDRLAKARETLR